MDVFGLAGRTAPPAVCDRPLGGRGVIAEVAAGLGLALIGLAELAAAGCCVPERERLVILFTRTARHLGVNFVSPSRFLVFASCSDAGTK